MSDHLNNIAHFESATQSVNALLTDPDSPRFVNTDIRNAPNPRRFIYERLYIRGSVTGTAATGGTGKTSIVDVETIGMAIGRNLLTNETLRAGSLRVLVLSLEDPEDEYQRRANAVKRHYMLSDDDVALVDQNLFQLFDRHGDFKVVQQGVHGLVRNQAVFDAIAHFIERESIDVLVIDPLVSFHQADENSNIEMQMVLSVLRELADSGDIAVHYLHHNRKGGDSGADSMRGAVALRDGSRALRMLTRMTKDEAKELNIPADKSGYYISMTSGKSNFAPPANERRWVKMESVDLDNETDDYPADIIGVATAYKPPGLFDEFSMDTIRGVWQVIRKLPDNQRRADARSPDWIGYTIAAQLKIDLSDDPDKANQKRIKKMIHAWQDSSVLLKGSFKDDKRNDRGILFYNEDRKHDE